MLSGQDILVIGILLFIIAVLCATRHFPMAVTLALTLGLLFFS